MSNKSLEYIKNANKRMSENPIGDFFVGELRIYIKEPVPEHIDVRQCFAYILQKMPKIFYENIDKVFIGQFPFLRKREVDAIYKDGCIYITNNQEQNESLMADIVHEMAHAFENLKYNDIYGDQEIKKEFLSKRKALFDVLYRNNLLSGELSKQDFYNTEYSEKFDNYLYKTVGYDKLEPLIRNIFISPYAATCLREYFANAFEIFFVNDLALVQKYTPHIYNKLIQYLEF
jgi:hypothetical protein